MYNSGMKYQASIFSADTTADAAARQIETLRAIGTTRRAEMTFQLSDNLRAITEAGIRYRHPDYTDRQVVQAVLRLTLEKDVFEQVFPGCEILP